MAKNIKEIIKAVNKRLKPLKSLMIKLRQQQMNLTGELLGYLESPQVMEKNVNGTLGVSGWILHKQVKITALMLVRSGFPEEQIIYGIARPDVAQVFPEIAGAEASGFGWNILLDRNYTGKVKIEIWAIMENGDRLCCFKRDLTVQAQVQDNSRSLNLYLFLSGAARKAWVAYKQGRLPLSPLAWMRYLRRYYRQLNAVEYLNVAVEYANVIHPWQKQDPYQRWIEINRLTPKLLSRMQADAEKLQHTGVKISVVVPVYNTPPQFLREAIASVTAQIYPHWELCLADDASTLPHVKEILDRGQASDPRIKVIFRQENGHIAAATNSALDLATGDFIAFLDHDDLLSPDALLHVAECINKYPDVDWIYTDEDKIDGKGYRFDYQMKGGWSLEMAITHNYTHHLTAIRKSLIDRVGGMRKGFEGAQDLDLFLRVTEQTTNERIRHIPHICYHWRVHPESTASHGRQKQYVFDNAYLAIEEAIARRGIKAKPFLPAIFQQRGLCLHQLAWDSSILAENSVTIVIPTRDRVDLLAKCISSLERTVDQRFVKIIIVDDRSESVKTRQYLEQLENKQICRVIRPDSPDRKFNYARLVNLAAAEVDTPLMLQLNNDIEAIAPGWLEDMVGWMSVEGVAVVGARLLYPDRTIQHAGVVVGTNQGLAGNLFKGQPQTDLDYIFLPHAARNVSAVTGACMLTSTARYRELGGFDAENLAVEFNDVDYCLRVCKLGKRIVYTPQATLIHRESASRKNIDYNPREHLSFIIKHLGYRDPFFNENIEIENEIKAIGMELNPRHFGHAERISNLNILLITHNLNLEGAPLMAYAFAKYFATVGDFQVTVISLEDGPLRWDYESLNIPVKIIPDNLKVIDPDLKQYRQRLKNLGESLDITQFDLVISNTIVSFWGIELAHLFGLPSIWHIHESSNIPRSIAKFFGESPESAIGQLLPDCFKNASRVVFVADATRSIFHELDVRGNFRTIHGGLDIDRINEYRQAHAKSELRAKYGIEVDRTVITLVGTICERKGQLIFIEAIGQLAKQYPGFAHLDFIIVGPPREEVYFNCVQKQLKKLNMPNVKIYKETREIYDFYAMSDIFICASFEESFPRVLLEAMAFELKIVSTAVYGIVEMIGDREHGYLVPPGDPQALAAAMLKCLSEENASKMAAKAYAKVCRMYNNRSQLQKHLLMAKEVAIH
ncbi:MAG: glycosyltransferase [Hormoscilla sp. SP5CHS1]|nr:glycosyltransferase [Hormoscilla sp. SP5CHS1]